MHNEILDGPTRNSQLNKQYLSQKGLYLVHTHEVAQTTGCSYSVLIMCYLKGWNIFHIETFQGPILYGVYV